MKQQLDDIRIKIAFDAHTLMESQKTGIGRVADNIVKNFISDKDFKCYLNVFTMGKKKDEIRRLFNYKNAKIQKFKFYPRGAYLRTWKYFPISYNCLFKYQADITQFWGADIPPGVKGKKVVMVHDMTYKAYPETMDLSVKRILERNMIDTCKRADRIVTVSNFSKQEILKYIDVDPKKIAVMPCGVDHSKYHVIQDRKKIDNIKKKYKISGDYYIYVGTLEPRKNILFLIHGYMELKKRKKYIPKLVLAGKKGWMYEEIFNVVKKYNLESEVIFTGYLDDHEVPILLNGAIAFIFPSLYEGFGIPPLEAMACGIPVIVANRASLPEVVEDAGILIEPDDTENLVNSMWELYSNINIRNYYIDKGVLQAKKFTWEKSAQILKEVYQSLLEKKWK